MESILNVKRITEACDEPVVIVVSALGGVTDKLIHTSKLALEGNPRYIDAYNEMVNRHHQLIDAIIPDTDQQIQLLKVVDALRG